MTISLLVWARIFPEAAIGVEYSNPTHFHSMALEDLIPLGTIFDNLDSYRRDIKIIIVAKQIVCYTTKQNLKWTLTEQDWYISDKQESIF